MFAVEDLVVQSKSRHWILVNNKRLVNKRDSVGRLDRQSSVVQLDEEELLILLRRHAIRIVNVRGREKIFPAEQFAVNPHRDSQAGQMLVLQGRKIPSVAVPQLGLSKAPRHGLFLKRDKMRRDVSIQCPAFAQNGVYSPTTSRNRGYPYPAGFNESCGFLVRKRGVYPNVVLPWDVTDLREHVNCDRCRRSLS